MSPNPPTIYCDKQGCTRVAAIGVQQATGPGTYYYCGEHVVLYELKGRLVALQPRGEGMTLFGWCSGFDRLPHDACPRTIQTVRGLVTCDCPCHKQEEK